MSVTKSESEWTARAAIEAARALGKEAWDRGDHRTIKGEDGEDVQVDPTKLLIDLDFSSPSEDAARTVAKEDCNFDGMVLVSPKFKYARMDSPTFEVKKHPP